MGQGTANEKPGKHQSKGDFTDLLGIDYRVFVKDGKVIIHSNIMFDSYDDRTISDMARLKPIEQIIAEKIRGDLSGRNVLLLHRNTSLYKQQEPFFNNVIYEIFPEVRDSYTEEELVDIAIAVIEGNIWTSERQRKLEASANNFISAQRVKLADDSDSRQTANLIINSFRKTSLGEEDKAEKLRLLIEEDLGDEVYGEKEAKVLRGLVDFCIASASRPDPKREKAKNVFFDAVVEKRVVRGGDGPALLKFIHESFNNPGLLTSTNRALEAIKAAATDTGFALPNGSVVRINHSDREALSEAVNAVSKEFGLGGEEISR